MGSVQHDRQVEPGCCPHESLQSNLALLGLILGHSPLPQRIVRQANFADRHDLRAVLLNLGDDGFHLGLGETGALRVKAKRGPNLVRVAMVQGQDLDVRFLTCTRRYHNADAGLSALPQYGWQVIVDRGVQVAVSINEERLAASSRRCSH